MIYTVKRSVPITHRMWTNEPCPTCPPTITTETLVICDQCLTPIKGANYGMATIGIGHRDDTKPESFAGKVFHYHQSCVIPTLDFRTGKLTHPGQTNPLGN